jgi:Protein of unknown function (DUF2637)
MSDTAIRRMTAAAVLLVAAIAAIAAVISFTHIQYLAATHGQATVAAYLLPLSIDGTVVAASMVMLRAAPPLPQARRNPELPAPPGRDLPGGIHLHFHGVSAQDIAAILRSQDGPSGNDRRHQ